MSQFESIISALKTEPYSTKKQLLEYTLRIIQGLQNGKKSLEDEDKNALLKCAFDEVDAQLLAIPKAASYKEKDLIFACEDLVLGLIMHLCPTPEMIPPENQAKIKTLIELVAKERYIETTIDDLFKQESVSKADMCRLLSLVADTEDEYQRGMFYNGLIHYKKDISKLSDGAKSQISGYIAAEMNRYLTNASLHAECVNNLELIADVSCYFADDAVTALLYEVVKLGYSNVNYYAAGTLLSLGASVPNEVIVSLAHDLEYANLAYILLKEHGKQNIFPAECSTEEYLAKSDMVRWLMYPTELGKAPDEIVYIGKITYLFKKEVYHVFKYRSDSDTLDEKLKNKWLIGWSSDDGGTFSNFDEYELYEKATVSATLKNIKKKLIG